MHNAKDIRNPPVGTLHRISAKNAVLAPTGWKASRAALAKAHAKGALKPVSLDDLPLNRRYTPHTKSSGMSNQKPEGFEWNHEDQLTRSWWPQAVTTSSDSTASGKIHGRKWVAATWHSGDGKRSRISFADVTHPNDPAKGRYRNVELMVPDTKHPGKFIPLARHVGGVSWVGHFLYVADTHGGLRMFDMRQLSRVKDPKSVPKGTLPYILPQVGFYKIPSSAKHKRGTPVFSGLSLDRKHHRLISEEYKHGKAGGVIASWPIDLKTGLLKTQHGRVHANAEWSSPVKGMAGVLSYGDGFQIASMGRPHSHLLSVKNGHKAIVKDSLWAGVQQFSWDQTLKQIWTLGEHRGHRAVWHFKPE